MNPDVTDLAPTASLTAGILEANWSESSLVVPPQVLLLRRMAAAHATALQLLDAEGEARLVDERGLRHHLQEDARQVLGALFGNVNIVLLILKAQKL